MPRFVILRHDSPQGEHFDLMLEAGDVKSAVESITPSESFMLAAVLTQRVEDLYDLRHPSGSFPGNAIAAKS